MKGVNTVLKGDCSIRRDQRTDIFAGHPPLASGQRKKIRSIEDRGQAVDGEQALSPALNHGQKVERIAGIPEKASLTGTGALDTRQEGPTNFATHACNMKHINGFGGLNDFGWIVDRQGIGLPGRGEGIQWQSVDSQNSTCVRSRHIIAVGQGIAPSLVAKDSFANNVFGSYRLNGDQLVPHHIAAGTVLTQVLDCIV